MNKIFLTVVALSVCQTANAQTYTTMQWGVNRAKTPAAFAANNSGTWLDLGTISANGRWSLTKAKLDDRSATNAPTSFFETNYYGNPASGVVHRANRLFVGEATGLSGDVLATPVKSSWIHDYWPNVGQTSVLNVGDNFGSLGISAWTRTSDFRRWTGQVSQGSQAINAFAVNDGAGIAVPFFGGSIRTASGTGITLSQLDTSNAGNVVDTDPYTGVFGGTTWGLGITAGWTKGAANPITAYMYLGNQLEVTKEQRAEAGIIAMQGAFDKTKGSSGGGVFAKLARGHEIDWINPSHGTDAYMYGDAQGIVLAPKLLVYNKAGDSSMIISGSSGSYLSLTATSLNSYTGALYLNKQSTHGVVIGGKFSAEDDAVFNGIVRHVKPIGIDPIKLAALPSCVMAYTGYTAVIVDGVAYSAGAYGSAVGTTTGSVIRKVFCTNATAPTTYAWVYN